MRIEEPFLKGHVALWLAGAEPHPETIRSVLTDAGYSHLPSRESRVTWTGQYEGPGRPPITVVSRPGVDIYALLPGARVYVAECKGEPTQAGTKAGLDRTAFRTGLGQLVISAGGMSPTPSVSILAVPNTPRLSALCRDAAKNEYVRQLGISILMVDSSGQVTEV